MLALGLNLGTPRINTFSGEAMPGKAEVSFEQWNHEIQCIKDHYPESVVWESIVRSLKGAAADMAHCIQNFGKFNSNLWHSGIIRCPYAKLTDN